MLSGGGKGKDWETRPLKAVKENGRETSGPNEKIHETRVNVPGNAQGLVELRHAQAAKDLQLKKKKGTLMR